VLIRPSWECFSIERAARTPVAAGWLANNIVHATLPARATHYDLVKFICGSAKRPIPVVTLCEDLREFPLLRGRSLSGVAGDLLDQIVIHHRDVDWWVTDEGLHMEVVPPDTAVSELSIFDRIAGAMVSERWEENPQKRNTNLSLESLLEIATELDRAKFKLLDVLQPKQKVALLKHNDLMASKGIKTFERAAKNPTFSHMLRRRLYVARDTYSRAASTLKKRPTSPIPAIFSSYPPVI
jgi:hypothetical protein